jgi:hypothetical protein
MTEWDVTWPSMVTALAFSKISPEVASLNGTVGRRPQVNLRSGARCLNTIGQGVQPDQWRPRTGALDLRSSPHSPVQRIHLSIARWTK